MSYTRAKIIEENHYYACLLGAVRQAFGLHIAGISSRKFDGGMEGDLINHYLYNDKELFEDADLNWYDYGFRNYDPQIARFTQLDPLTWDCPALTNYQYASNELLPVKEDHFQCVACITSGFFSSMPYLC